MGAWIEIHAQISLRTLIIVAPHDGCVDWNFLLTAYCLLWALSRTPRWVRGLKLLSISFIIVRHSRTPRWVRGLKSFNASYTPLGNLVAPHDGCVDWNVLIFKYSSGWLCRTPRWVRGLKYQVTFVANQSPLVAPHDGCVDWNFSKVFFYLCNSVAPHDGCVDWN